MTNTKNRQSGFTLIELMITVVLIAVIVGMAGPPFRAMLLDNRLAASADIFMSSLAYTRSEALKRNGGVCMCKSVDGESCTSSGTWEQGWLIHSNTGDNSCNTVEPDDILQREGAVPSGVRIITPGGIHRFRYLGNGSSTLAGNTRFSFCSPDGDADKTREITVSVTGRPRLAKGGGDDC